VSNLKRKCIITMEILFQQKKIKKNPNWFIEIRNLRHGEFEDASKETKICWYIFVGKIMTCISKEWNDDTVKLTSIMMKHTTPSDEALVISSIIKKLDTWIKYSNEELEDNIGDDVSQSPKNKKTVVREAWTDEEIKQFYNRQVRINELRKNEMTGYGWDTAYQVYLKEHLMPKSSESKKIMIY